MKDSKYKFTLLDFSIIHFVKEREECRPSEIEQYCIHHLKLSRQYSRQKVKRLFEDQRVFSSVMYIPNKVEEECQPLEYLKLNEKGSALHDDFLNPVLSTVGA